MPGIFDFLFGTNKEDGNSDAKTGTTGRETDFWGNVKKDSSGNPVKVHKKY